MGGYAPCSGSPEGKTVALHLPSYLVRLTVLLTIFSSFIDGFNRTAEIWNRFAAYVPNSQGSSLPWLCIRDGGPVCCLKPYYF